MATAGIANVPAVRPANETAGTLLRHRLRATTPTTLSYSCKFD